MEEVEATNRLVEIYQNGKMVENDEEEYKRLFRIAKEGIEYLQTDGLEWGVEQKKNTLCNGRGYRRK